MSAKPKNIFTRSKPLMNIYSGLDHEGKEVEVREDAEQLVKWHEISDALVAAGYYRAQLQGLSEFDKIVGGLTWCIELCDIDVDVSLLFEENLTIGKKIALTEKIVKVLRSMKCPFLIEPHQIQGLDFINILPLVHWLIKYSSEFREAKEDELRRFAVMQYDKDHIFESDRPDFMQKEKFLRNICAVQNLYKPCRVRKRKGGLPANELEQVNATLSEYDQRTLLHVSTSKEGQDEGLDFLYDYEKTLADPSHITTEITPTPHTPISLWSWSISLSASKTSQYGLCLDCANTTIRAKMNATTRLINTDENNQSSDTKVHYAVLHSELTGELSKELEMAEKIKYSEDIDRLTKTIDKMELQMRERRDEHQKKMEIAKLKYTDLVGKLQKITSKLMPSDTYSEKNVKEMYKSLKELARERNELLQVIQHRKHEHDSLTEQLRQAQNPDTKVEEPPLTPEELKEFSDRQCKLKEFISNIRLELGALNREVLRYTVAIDEVPGTVELLQYEKRFIELYNQVASKHKETKQYFIFYNTLYEVKLYTSKELSLLNSILDNYEDAMSSTRKREEFMSQFESIVEWVNQSVKKVEQKFIKEKDQKTTLHYEYSRLMDVQRQYAAVLKKLAEERQKNKDRYS